MSSLATLSGVDQNGSTLACTYVSTSNSVETFTIWNANDSTIEDDNGTIRFKDVSINSPGQYAVTTTSTQPSSGTSTLNFLVANNSYVHAWTASGATYKGYFQITYVSSGPTVTSITVANEISSTRQFTVTHTGTLTASDISYTLNGTDITTFGSPSTPITNLQSTSTGSTFDSYTLSKQGSHSINIGNVFLNFYVLSGTQTENDIVSNNNISVTFPDVDVTAPEPWTNQLGTLVSGTTTSIRSFSNNRVRIKLLKDTALSSIMIHKSFNSNTGYSIVLEHWDYNDLTNNQPS